MRRLARIITLALCATTLSALASPPAHAAGEAFRVLAVQTTGCTSGAFGMLVDRTNLDGGTYNVRTVVTVGEEIYMNENATISVNGQSGWNLFDNFTYGAVPNPGTWPIPQNTQLRINVTLERPVGTVLFDWTTVVDACNTGTILYNGRTSVDVDQDMVTTVADQCPTIYGDAANGCPQFTRTLTLKYAAGGQKFKGKLKAAGAPALQQAQVVTIWKVRPGPDKRVGRATTAGNGGFSVAKKAKPGKYYASAGSVLVPATGAATEVTTTKLKLP